MRIIELLEGKHFNDLQFVKVSDDSGKKEIDFDLSDDLIFYMNNNDDAYRRHLHPVVAKCIDRSKLNKSVKPSIFEKAIQECYKMYTTEYPIRELPHSLDEELCNEICEKLHEVVCQHLSDGKYD